MAMQTRCFMPPAQLVGIHAEHAGIEIDRAQRVRAAILDGRARLRPCMCDLMASTICAPIRITGLSEFIAPCGM